MTRCSRALTVAIGLVALVSHLEAAPGSWAIMPPLPSVIQEVAVTSMNGLVYVAAGSASQMRTNALWSFDPGTSVWTRLAPYPGTALDHTALVPLGGFLYLIGGVTAWPQPSVTTVQRYDPVANTWTAVAPLPSARGATGSAALNGKIYVAGGLTAAQSVRDFTVYDPATDTWTTLPSMPTARDHLAAAALNGKFYAIGGRINGQTCSPFRTIEIFDPATNAWTTGTPMLNAHAGHAVGTANGHLQVFGGEGNSIDCGTIAASEDFDPNANAWTQLPNMPTPRHGVGGGTIDSTVYIPGGGTWTADQPTNEHERYDANGTPPPALPSPWLNQDVGPVGIMGSASGGGGSFTVQAAGADIWGSVDSFYYVYQPLVGNGQIIARIASLQNTNGDAKAGVMIRESITTGARSVLAAISPNGSAMISRTNGGQPSSFLGGSSSVVAPSWVKLARSGNTFTAWTSPDGVNWTTVANTTIGMGQNTNIGIAVTSHNTSALTTAAIDNVSVSGGAGNNPPTVSLTSPASGATYAAPATIALAANASDTDGSITQVEFFNGSTSLGVDTSAPYTATWSSVPAGTYTLTAVATDNGGLRTTSSGVTVTVTGGSPGPLPTGWTSQDVGSTGAAGSATFNAGTFTVNGSGSDIWGTADAFQYAFQTLAGDGEVVARVASLQNTHTFAKAGIMFRETLTPDSSHVLFDMRPSGALEFMTRIATGGTTNFIAGGTQTAPAWLKIRRAGNLFAAFVSANGTAWTQIGSVGVQMAGTVDVGLVVTSHVAGTLATATFDSVAVTPAAPPNAPPAVTLTSPANGSTFTAPATIPLGASASDSDGAVAKVDFFNGGSLIGTVTSSPYNASWTNVQAGTYSITAVATDNSGATTSSGAATVTVSSPPPPGGLPSPWVDQDIGSVGAAGSASFTSGVFTVKGSGGDVWGSADAFNYAYQALAGDGQIVAHVASVQNTSSVAKAGVMLRESLTAGSAHVILDVKPGGGIEFMTRSTTGGNTSFIAGNGAAAPVWLKLTRAGSTITGFVSSDGNTWTQVGTTTTSMGSANIGLVVTSHAAGTLNTSTFDNVAVVGGSGAAPPISFSRKTIAAGGSPAAPAFAIAGFTGPTSVAVGPDGRLYASIVNGKIFIMTLDRTKLTDPSQPVVTSVQELDDIYNLPSKQCTVVGDPASCSYPNPPTQGRQVTGIMIGPESTATHTVLYVSHSGLGTAAVDPAVDTYSGTITRLTLDPNTSTPDPNDYSVTAMQDLVVGIPRSIEAHSPNGLALGPDGWLYLGNGGNTNAGAPSQFFGNLKEYYLSAAVLRLNLQNLAGRTLPIDVSGVRAASDLPQFNGVFELYATGYRNPYDLTWHSNGRLYLNGNAANQSQGNTPGTADGCNTPSISPGDEMDYLALVTPGAYGGHPDPARGECVWHDGTVYNPDIPPQPNYVPPLTRYVAGNSTNGIVEYRSSAFGGQMIGNLITATYSGDQTVRRVVLSADGLSVVSVTTLGQFLRPLDVTTDSSGVIYVAEYAGNDISVMIPAVLAACPVAGSNPATTDSDGDGYMDADETAAGSDPCSAASKPSDFDGDHVSDVNDPDDDNDGIPDVSDQLQNDPQNGAATAIPLAFEYDPSSPSPGGIQASGFTGVQISTNAAKEAGSGHALNRQFIHAIDAGGHLTLQTSSGTAEGTTNTQVNALQLGFDSSADFRIWTRIVQPFDGTTPAVGHVGAAFFGPDEDNYARVGIVGNADGTASVVFGVEQGGAFVVKELVNLGAPSPAAIATLDVYLVGRVSDHTITAYYDLNTSGTMQMLGAPAAVPAAWFSTNVGGAANTSLAGLMVSHGSATPMAFGYEFYRIDRNVPPPPTPQPPAPPGNPVPATGAANVPTNTGLSWSSGSALSWFVDFGTTNPPPPAGRTLTRTYQPPPLAAGTVYYWRVTVEGESGSTAGPVWSFTTAAAPPPPPGPPTSPSPADGAVGVPTDTGLSWSAPPANSYLVEFGTTNPPPVAGRTLTRSYQPSPLAAGTVYYWRVTVEGESGITRGPTWSFTTAAAPPPPPPAGDIVIYASDVPSTALHGMWTTASDATSPNGVRLSTPDTGFASTDTPASAPTHYVDVSFTAAANTPYTIWLRLKALNNSKYNDSIWVQFSDASANGSTVYPMNSSSALLVNLATDVSATSNNDWGWVNSAYWLSQAATLTFGSSGTHTMRIQVREDGVSLDQIVLSPTTYLTSPPGGRTNDSTVVPKP